MRTAVAVAAASFLMAGWGSAQADDYFTELEVSDIRDAQEVGLRTGVLLGIAERRLAGLGLLEAEDPDTPGTGSRIGRALIKVLAPDAAAELEAAEEARAALDHDLSRYSRTELLRGYTQALEETMDNIDDAYERKRGDVRPSVESLRDFSEITLNLLRDLSPESENEEIALEDAIEETQLAFEGAKKALEIIPRNER